MVLYIIIERCTITNFPVDHTQSSSNGSQTFNAEARLCKADTCFCNTIAIVAAVLRCCCRGCCSSWWHNGGGGAEKSSSSCFSTTSPPRYFCHSGHLFSIQNSSKSKPKQHVCCLPVSECRLAFNGTRLVGVVSTVRWVVVCVCARRGGWCPRGVAQPLGHRHMCE